MGTLTAFESYLFLGAFWIICILLIRLFFRNKITISVFLVSERSVGWIVGAVTVAIAWVWAPALLVSSQKAFEQGIPGLFWFTLPNAGALILFAFLAARMRKIFDKGFTLPEYMGKRFDRRMEILYSVSIFIAQCYALIINLTGALLVLNLVTNIPKETLIIILGLMMLSLSLLKGIRSSIVEDSIKIIMIGVVAVLICPWVINSSGGLASITGGLGGSKGVFTNLFDPVVAWTFGVPITISLLSGIVIDQQQWQRAFSIKSDMVKKSFLWGGLIFALVPITLGLLGFIAANPAMEIRVSQNQLAGFSVVAQSLPTIGVIAFMAMILIGLIAAGSSALAAISSIGAINIYKMFHSDAGDKMLVKVSRISMILLLIIAMSIALIPNIQLLYLVLIIGVFRAALFFPTIFSLFWSKLSGNIVFWGIILGMITGIPLFVYGSITKNPTISSVGSLVPIIITLIASGLSFFSKTPKFNFNLLSKNPPKI